MEEPSSLQPIGPFVFPLKKGSCEFTTTNNNTHHQRSRRRRKLIVPETSRKLICQIPSSDPIGRWLLIICDKDENFDDEEEEEDDSCWVLGNCYLWDPITCEKIQLPSLLQWMITPTTTTNSSSSSNYSVSLSRSVLSGNLLYVSMVFLIFTTNNINMWLFYCRPTDKKWGIHRLNHYGIESLFCFRNNDLYVFSSWGGTKIQFLKKEEEELSIMEYSLELPENLPLVIPSGVGGFDTHVQHIKSGDDIFCVLRHFNSDRVFEIQIRKLDFSLLVWKQVTSLDDHVLFIDELFIDEHKKDHITGSCSASELGLTKGCIYYTMAGDDKNLYKFDLEDNSIHISLRSIPWVTPLDFTTTLLSSCDARTRDWLKNEDSNVLLAKENNTCVEEEEEEEEDNENVDHGANNESQVVVNVDILSSISSHLNPIDYVHFRGVSRSYRLGIPQGKWKASYSETTFSSPCLVFHSKACPIYTFVDPVRNNSKYLMNLSALELSGSTIRYSKGGWLLMSKGKTKVFFFNPFTRKKMKLPDTNENALLRGVMSFSSLPTSSECVTLSIALPMLVGVTIYFIRRGQNSWNRLVFRNPILPSTRIHMEPGLNNPVYLDGVFYCLDMDGILGTFSFEDAFKWEIVAQLKRPCVSFSQCYLVECDGSLLSIFVGILGEGIEIFRLDSSSKKKNKWVKVDSLGKYMLFISSTSCIAAIAPNSRMENNVYLHRFHGERILYYSLKTGKYHSVGSQHSAENFYNTKEPLDCSWIEPNWSSNTDEELDWLEV